MPLVYRALLADRAEGRVTHVDAARPRRRAGSPRSAGCSPSRRAGVARRPRGDASPPTSTRRCAGADFVFSAIRVGGLEGRAVDERVALDEGVLGQETVGAGGIAYGLRTVPVADRHRPAGRRGSPPTPGSSTSPTRPGWSPRRWPATSATGSSASATRRWASAGGWRARSASTPATALARLRRASTTSAGCAACASTGRDLLPEPARRRRPRSAPSRRAGSSAPTGCAALGAIPNEYLHYYYFNREAVRALPARPSRPAAPFLLRAAGRFYAGDGAAATAPALDGLGPHPARARGDLHGARTARPPAPASATPSDLESGGYEQVALALMRAIARDERTTLILNVRNRGTLSVLDADAVVEVPCLVDATARTRSPSTRCPATPPAWSARSRRSNARPDRGGRRPAPARRRCGPSPSTRSSTPSRSPAGCSTRYQQRASPSSRYLCA